MKDDASEISRFRNDTHTLLARANRLELELAQRNKDVVILQKALRDARKHPVKSLKRKIEFKILRSLSEGASWLPADMRHRFALSAKKRDPKRDELAARAKPKNNLTYSQMVERWELLRKNKEEDKIKCMREFTYRPRISIVVPVYNPDPNLLLKTIRSVIEQSYTEWELCIADDCSTNPEVRKVLEDCIAENSNIKVMFRSENGHISRATNSALELASGDFIALLDHDDLLDRDALFYFVRELQSHPDAVILYSDEDKVDLRGERSEPHFKPDFNREFLYSCNYISHFGMYRREVVEKIGGFRVGFEGAQDYDLLLRVLEQCSEQQVRHIPKVLYSWRASPGSTAGERSEKSYAVEAGRLALEEHLKRQYAGTVCVGQGDFPLTYRVEWPITKNPMVSLIIPTRDMVNILRVAVESILKKTTYENYEIIIIDNGSEKAETLRWFEEIQALDARVQVLRDNSPFNYSRLNNRAVEMAKGDVLGLVNNDVEVISPDWLTEMVSLAIRDDVGCVGAKLYYPDDTVQHAGVVIGMGGVAAHTHSRFQRDDTGYFMRLCSRQEYSAVTAACLLVRKDIFYEVDGLNEDELTVAFNDVDFCLKVGAAGYRNVWTPYAELYHYESISRGYEDTPEKLARFKREVTYMKETWATDKFRDPAYNANLSLSRLDFSIGEPQWEL